MHVKLKEQQHQKPLGKHKQKIYKRYKVKKKKKKNLNTTFKFISKSQENKRGMEVKRPTKANSKQLKWQ